MGNGPKRSSDVAKTPPRAAYSVAAAAAMLDEDDAPVASDGGSGTLGSGQPESGGPVEFCERVHELRFHALNGAAPRLHQAVRLVFASPLLVANTAGEHIGEVADPRESAIRQCLVSGYVMVGQVSAPQTAGQPGTIRISGTPHAALE